MNNQPRTNYQEIDDLIKIGSNPDSVTYHRPDGKFVSNYERDLVYEHQDMIRGNTTKTSVDELDSSVFSNPNIVPDLAMSRLNALKAIDTPDDILEALPASYFYSPETEGSTSEEIPSELAVWLTQDPSRIDRLDQILNPVNEQAHDPEKAKELIEGLGFNVGGPILVRVEGKTDNSLTIKDAYVSNGTPIFVLERKMVDADGNESLAIIETNTPKLLKFTESTDKYMVSLRRKRDKSEAGHADFLYEEGARLRNELRRNQNSDQKQRVPISARFGAWVSTKWLSSKEKWANQGRAGKIATVGSAVVAMVATAYTANKYGLSMVDNTPSAEASGAGSPNKGGIFDQLTDQISEVSDKFSHQSGPEPTTPIIEGRSFNVAKNEGFTQLFERLAVNRGYHPSPDQLYEIYQQLPNLDTLDGTYVLPNGDLGIDSKTIRLNREQMEVFEKLLKETRQ